MNVINRISFLLVIFVLILSGCNQSSPSEDNFVPPRDKIVTEEMAKKYAKISVELNQTLTELAIMIEDFRAKNNISLDMNELNDDEYKKKHPEIIKEWQDIQNNWQEKQTSIYEKYGMSEDEWDWIAGALIMPRNQPIQDFIREEIERLEKEKLQEEKQSKDNK